MFFSLIICTYNRPKPIIELLDSVLVQTLIPNEILIIDGSVNQFTKQELENRSYKNLTYYQVGSKGRGLTKQRNIGINNVSSKSKVVCFLDDDTVLCENYFEEIINTYKLYPEALGVGGYITNEVKWNKVTGDYKTNNNQFFYDGWVRSDGSRFVLRKKLGLDSDCLPGFLPEFSHGRSISFIPPSNKIYEVEQLMGGVSSFKKEVFEEIQFSEFFEGYGLYEDADFTLRLSRLGKLYINTKANLAHFHDPSGRPNQYSYGVMVVRNGWYVWRVRHLSPSFKSIVKWHIITFLLTVIRISNIFTTSKRKEALTESVGRIVGWFSLFFQKPK